MMDNVFKIDVVNGLFNIYSYVFVIMIVIKFVKRWMSFLFENSFKLID